MYIHLLVKAVGILSPPLHWPVVGCSCFCLHLLPLSAETSDARYHTQVLLLLFCFVFNIVSGDRTWVLVLVQQTLWLSHHSSQGP